MSVQQTAKPIPTAEFEKHPAPASAATPAPYHPRLITDITVEHGPVDLFGRFFLKADTAARRRGVTLSFGTFEDLLEVNQQNRDSWKALTTIYDHRVCPQGLAPERAFCILGRDARGKVVATHAGRVFDVRDDDTLHDIAVGLRLFYDDPEKSKNPGERCEVTAIIAQSIRGKLLINGAVWYHPAYRKLNMAKIIPRVARAYAYTRWKIDHSMGIVIESADNTRIIDRLGYPYREWDLKLINSSMGSGRCCLAWMHANEIVEDLDAWLVGFDAEIDSGVNDRRAQQQG
jgi:hypothetical protein